VNDSPYDLMWGGGPWASLSEMQLDVGHDDYFQARIPGCPDLSGSRFLEGGGATLGLTVTHREGAGGSVDACSERDPVCDVTLVDPASMRATFVPVEVPVRVFVRGGGRVVSAPAAVACPRRCFAKLRYGTTLTLRAVPARKWRFAGWTGSCQGTARCRLSLTGSSDERRVRARFARRL